MPRSAARNAAAYPPGPPPITATRRFGEFVISFSILKMCSCTYPNRTKSQLLFEEIQHLLLNGIDVDLFGKDLLTRPLEFFGPKERLVLKPFCQLFARVPRLSRGLGPKLREIV